MRSEAARRTAVAIALAVGYVPISAQAPERAYTDFTAGACALTPRMVDHFAAREHRDTSAYSPARDSTSRIAADSARYCASVYGGTVEDWQLLNHARVQLIIGADAEARAAAEKYLASLSASTAEKKAWALYLIERDNLVAHPARIAAALEAVDRLDKLGPGGASMSVLAHMALSQAHKVKWNDSASSTEASKTVAIWKRLDADAQVHLASVMAEAFLSKAEIQLRTIGPTAARAVVDTAIATIPSGAFSVRRQVELAARLYGITGKKVASIDASFWFNAGGRGVTRPESGKVTIISEVSHACGGFCRPRYDALRRFSKRYADRGLELINVTKTMGYYDDTAGVTPAEEARHDSAYFLTRKALPGLLAVYETKFRWLADGRRRDEPTPQELNYPYASLVIVDKKGIVRYVSTGWDASLEEPLAHLVDRLLLEPDGGQ